MTIRIINCLCHSGSLGFVLSSNTEWVECSVVNDAATRLTMVNAYLLFHYPDQLYSRWTPAPYRDTLNEPISIGLAFCTSDLIRPTTETESIALRILRKFQDLKRFTCRNVRPSSRNKRKGTSVSMGFLSSDQPVWVRYCAPDTAHIGVLMSVKLKRREINKVLKLKSIETFAE